MSTTPHLALPLLAAAQAQKHVTHNEALVALDALVHLSVKERDRNNPPATPTEGDRYLVGSAGIGAFAGHNDEIALFDLGIWRFFQPNPGWRAYVEADETIVVFNGMLWRNVAGDVAIFDQLGIGTQPDAQNPLAAKLNSALFTAKENAEGGTGDLRVVLNKETSGNVLSQLYQSGYRGRAETGLVGNDDFGIRVSPDGNEWHDALRVDSTTGMVSFPSGYAGASGNNLLINPAFLVNQRAYAGTALTAGVYGYDRWKSGAAASTMSRLADGTQSFTGILDQVVDVAQASSLVGAPDFAGQTLTFSVENLSAPISVTIGSKTASLTEGPGRRSVTVTLDASSTGHLLLRLQGSGTTTFLRPKLEIGERATPWIGNWLDVEEHRCRRYYHRITTTGTTLLPVAGLAQRKGPNLIELPFLFPVTMRAAPVIQTSSMSWVGASPVGNQVSCYDPVGATWLFNSGSVLITSAVPISASAIALRFQASISFGGTAGTVCQVHFGNTAFIGLQAEL